MTAAARRARVLFLVGGVLSLVGGVTTLIYLLQPWRSCPYEDTSAGCAMLPGDAAIMTAAMLVVVAGFAVLLAGLVVATTRPLAPRSR